jgi:hypothetical protein
MTTNSTQLKTPAMVIIKERDSLFHVRRRVRNTSVPATRVRV